METEIIRENLPRAAEILRQGGLVGVPTETVYGLAGNGLDPSAVERIYEVKGRPPVKPLSLMIHGPEAMDRCACEIPPCARDLAERFWPGPLTIVVKARPEIPSVVLAGGTTVGLRCPDHPMTLELLRLAEIPLAAPSANPSGEPSPLTAEDVIRYFDGKIEAVIDGGACGIGTESTLLSVAEKPYRILRQGALPAETIADALVDRMTIIGITGGSGSGKTSALHVLEEMDAEIIDADAVYHRLLDQSGEMIGAIAARFPSALVDQKIDRSRLGEIVFADPDALSELNALTHPFVVSEVRAMLREHAMNGGDLAAIDAIELFSSGLNDLCDVCCAVIADRETRIRRIMARDGISRSRAEQRIDAQRPDDYFVKLCGIVLENNADEAAFSELCREHFKEIYKHG